MADSALNRWHIENSMAPPFLYGWTENRVAAGHAVVIRGQGGCLRCGLGPTGIPDFQATTWPDDTLLEEPACGNHFQPYGAVELGFIVDLIAETALDTLLDAPEHSRHSLWLGRRRHLEAQGGRWSNEAIALLGDDDSGARCLSRDWPKKPCPVCGSAS